MALSYLFDLQRPGSYQLAQPVLQILAVASAVVGKVDLNPTFAAILYIQAKVILPRGSASATRRSGPDRVMTCSRSWVLGRPMWMWNESLESGNGGGASSRGCGSYDLIRGRLYQETGIPSPKIDLASHQEHALRFPESHGFAPRPGERSRAPGGLAGPLSGRRPSHRPSW